MNDKEYIEKVKTISIRGVSFKENLPYGNKSRGRFIPPTGGRRGILVPSWGALEKEEVDYYVEKALYDEDNRIKENKPTIMKENIGKLTAIAKLAPKGKRSKAISDIIKENGG